MDALVFGGSFNPIHHGHLLVSRAVAEARNFAKVLLIPSGQPAQKELMEMAPAADRLEMCRRAVAGAPLFGVDDLEIRRPGPSFALDTVRQLRQAGFQTVRWLIGADWVQALPTWHEAEQLVREVEFLIVGRRGYAIDWEKLSEPFRALRKNVVTAPVVEISSSDIRRRIAAGMSIKYLVPERVENYLLERGLYRPGKPQPGE